jgi:hypothetical protein
MTGRQWNMILCAIHERGREYLSRYLSVTPRLYCLRKLPTNSLEEISPRTVSALERRKLIQVTDLGGQRVMICLTPFGMSCRDYIHGIEARKRARTTP